MSRSERGPGHAPVAARILCLLLLLSPALAAAFEGRLLLPDGESPAAGWEVSVIGLPVSVTTDASGLFRIIPDPPVPFRVVASGPDGTVSAPMEVSELSSAVLELVMPPAFADSVTVVSGVAPGIEAPPAAANVVLGEEYLEQRRPARLFEALEGVAGTSRTDETSSGVPVIRGLARGRTVVLLDGARVTAERRAGASATFLDPFTLAAVEVARGPGSVAYGSDAFGGVINARSRYPAPGDGLAIRFQADGAFGAHDEQAVAAEVAGDVLGGALLGVFHTRRADEAEAGGGDPIPLSFYEDRGGALRYTAATPVGRLRLGFAAVDAEDVGKPASDSDTTRTIYPLERSRRFNLALDARPLPGWETLDLAAFFGGYRLVLDRDRLATPTSTRLFERSDVDADDASLRAVAGRAAGGGRLQIGAEVVSRFGLEAIAEQRTFDAAGEPVAVTSTAAIEDATRTNSALFATFDRSLGARALLSAGLRGDHVEAENQGGFFGDRSTTHEALSGHLAVTVNPVEDLTATVQVARGFRDPTLSDRYFRGPSGRGFVIGNPDLEPEKSLQYDASVRWALGSGTVALYGYHYDIENLIERFRPDRDFFFRNRGEAQIQGVELEVQKPLLAGFGLEIGAAWARGEAEDGSPLDDIAPPNGALTLRWGGERGFAYGRVASFLEDDRPGPTEVPRPGYTTVDAGAGWHLTSRLELRAVGRNLTDRRYRDGGDEVASLARGRTVTLGIVGGF